MLCEQREMLQAIYLEAVAANVKAGSHIEDMKSEAWRAATKETRAICEETLSDLNQHRKEHGC